MNLGAGSFFGRRLSMHWSEKQKVRQGREERESRKEGIVRGYCCGCSRVSPTAERGDSVEENNHLWFITCPHPGMTELSHWYFNSQLPAINAKHCSWWNSLPAQKGSLGWEEVLSHWHILTQEWMIEEIWGRPLQHLWQALNLFGVEERFIIHWFCEDIWSITTWCGHTICLGVHEIYGTQLTLNFRWTMSHF